MMRRLLLLTAVPVLLVAACALPTDERAAPYDRDDLPPAIANTTTTSTTTTTTPTTTVPPTDSSGPTLPASTTTAAPIATAAVDLYYTIGFSDEMTRLKRLLPDDASTAQVINQLEAPLPDVAEYRYQTSVRRGLVTGDIVVDRGVATVALDGNIVDDMTETNLRRAIAQLVLTLTSFSTDDNGAIGRVRFEIDGDGFEVFVPAFGGSSEPGEELAFEDFSSLIATTATPTTTTTTTTLPDEPETTDPDNTAG
jgi:Sporulation and spore germination